MPNVLADSPIVVNALVESLCHDPFYIAITEGHGADETRRSASAKAAFIQSALEPKGAENDHRVIDSQGIP